MSRAPIPPTSGEGEALKRLTRQIDQAFEQAARLSGSNVAPADLYLGIVQKTLAAIEAPAGAVWLRTPQGFLQLQCQVNMAKVGLDDHKGGRQAHNELLRQAFQSSQAMVLEPDARITGADGAEAINRSAYPVVLAPIFNEDKQTLGLLEIWMDPNADPRLRPPFINFIIQMAGYASNYIRNTTNRRTSVQEQVYLQLEGFSRQIHSSLDPTEVAFHVANEGRRLIGCDRVSVGVRHGSSTTIEAVSGADVVEKSSTQIKRMSWLMDAVLNWNERLVYRGTRDETLPPRVLHALDGYLAESTAKLLVIQPLRDDREKKKEKDKEKPPTYLEARSALLLESYEPPEPIDAMLQRFDVVCSHASSALYNAVEMKRIPLRFLWKPIAALQGRAGGKRRFYTLLFLTLLVGLVLSLILVPYPLKLDAKGQLVPEDRNYLFPPTTGRVLQFKVKPGDVIRPGSAIAVMQDLDLAKDITEKLKQIKTLESEIETLRSQSTQGSALEKRKKADELSSKQKELDSINRELETILDINKGDRDQPGVFTVYAPALRSSRAQKGPTSWRVVSSDFLEQLTNRWVKPTEPLLRVGNTSGYWLIEQKIPQKHIGQVRRAFGSDDPNAFLEVDILVTSAPTQTYRGRLYQKDLKGEANPNRDERDQSEAVVMASIRINEDDIPAAYHIPEDLLVTGIEVHTKIRCGDRALGYALFYGVWEFLYENVIFAF